MWHKLLIADLPKRKNKSEKDYIQAVAVGKRIAADLDLVSESGCILHSIPGSWRKKIEKSAQKLASRGEGEIILKILERINGETKSS